MAFKSEYPNLAIVVPSFNEETTITSLLASLYGQQRLSRQNVTHIIVNNGSTDRTPEKIATWLKNHDGFPLTVIDEAMKGTGAASDTGFHAAIDGGAEVVARTDADCIPESNWAVKISNNFIKRPNLKLLGGRTVAIRDKYYRPGDDLFLGVAILGAQVALSIKNRANYLKVAIGHNTAVLAESYDVVGGIPRISINDADEDVIFSRRYLEEYGMRGVRIDQNVIVATSMRRFRAYGYIGMVGHHLFPFQRKGKDIDIR